MRTMIRTVAPRARVAAPVVQPLRLSRPARLLNTTAMVRAGVSNKHVDTDYNNTDTPFEFNEKSRAEISELLDKYPANYKQSAVIPMLWIAQKQNDGWLPLSAMNKTAELCEMSPILVYEVATFYTMFNRCVMCDRPSACVDFHISGLDIHSNVVHHRKKIGKYNLQMCTTTPCMVLGAYDVLDTIQKKLDVKIGGTAASERCIPCSPHCYRCARERCTSLSTGDTKDMMFHLMEVECLGACANAPMMQISHSGGDEYYVRPIHAKPLTPRVTLRKASHHVAVLVVCRRI